MSDNFFGFLKLIFLTISNGFCCFYYTDVKNYFLSDHRDNKLWNKICNSCDGTVCICVMYFHFVLLFIQLIFVFCRKPTTRRGKRILVNKQPKLIENVKQTLFIKGKNSSEVARECLKDLVCIRLCTQSF